MQRLPARVLIQRLEVLDRTVQLRGGLQAIAIAAAFRSQNLYLKSDQIAQWRTFS